MGEGSTAIPLLDGLAWTIVHSAWQGLLVAVVYRVGRAVVGNASRRYLLGLLCLLLLLALQVTTFACWYRWHGGEGIQLPFTLSTDSATEVSAHRELDLLGNRMPVTLPEPSWMLRTARQLTPAVSWLGWLWLSGALFFTLLFLVASYLLRREVGQCTPLDERSSDNLRQLAGKLRLKDEIRFVETRESSVPATCGWLHPVVLLPVKENLNLVGRHLDAIVLHELAHILRHDFLTQQLRRLIQLAYYFHPVVRSMDRHMTADSEEAADEIAATALGDPATYAAALLTLEETRIHTLKLGAAGGSLKDRLKHIVAIRHAQRRNPSRLSILLTLLFAILMVMACSELIVRAASPDQKLLVSMESRNLAEVVLASLKIPANVDRASPAIQKAVGELRSAGVVSAKALDELANAVHEGIPHDLLLAGPRHLQNASSPTLHDETQPNLGSSEERAAVAEQLSARAGKASDPQQQARLARAACALLAVDLVSKSGNPVRPWILNPKNVALMHLDPRTERDLDLGIALHLLRNKDARKVLDGLADMDEEAAMIAIEAAAYEPCWMLRFAASANVHDWKRLQYLLPEVETKAERRWQKTLPHQLPTRN